VEPSHPVPEGKQAEDGLQEKDRFALLRQHYFTRSHINKMIPNATAHKKNLLYVISHTTFTFITTNFGA
jgi:hypothetical protein